MADCDCRLVVKQIISESTAV